VPALRSSIGSARKSRTIELEQIENVQQRFPPPVAQPVEHRDAVLAADDDLAVEQARSAAQIVHGYSDGGISARPIEAVARDQPHAGLLPLRSLLIPWMAKGLLCQLIPTSSLRIYL
jgi:hypothetical protein